MSNGANSYVTSATITSGKLALKVVVDDFKPDEYVEVSGHATQSCGAFANYYDIQQVPEDADTSDNHRYVTVATDPLPPQRFREDQDVTVVVRVAKVWVTVLGPGQSNDVQPDPTLPPRENATWNAIRQVTDMNGGTQYPKVPEAEGDH